MHWSPQKRPRAIFSPEEGSLQEFAPFWEHEGLRAAGLGCWGPVPRALDDRVDMEAEIMSASHGASAQRQEGPKAVTLCRGSVCGGG